MSYKSGYLGGEEDYFTHIRKPGFDFRDKGVPDHRDASAPNDSNVKTYSTELVSSKY